MNSKKRGNRTRKHSCRHRKPNKKMTVEKFNCQRSCLVSNKVPRIPITVLKIGKVIGAGNFGQVVLSEALCPQQKLKHMEWCPPNIKSVRVILKELLKPNNGNGNGNGNNKYQIDFVNEINITWELSQSKIKSNNIVRMFGVVMEHNNPINPRYIILEECQLGSLEGYLHNPKNTISQTLSFGLMKDITAGMMYIHEVGYVHCDLACRNVLLDKSKSKSKSKMVAKVGDFGMCRPKSLEYREYIYRETQKINIPIRWSSLETFTGIFSEKSDLWAFGITICEIYSRAQIPYSNTLNFNNKIITSNKEVQEFVTQGGIHNRPVMCPTMIYEILLRCWQHPDTHNPICSFVELDKILKNIHRIKTRLPNYF